MADEFWEEVSVGSARVWWFLEERSRITSAKDDMREMSRQNGSCTRILLIRARGWIERRGANI